jgi:UDP-glucose 4-epimerase
LEGIIRKYKKALVTGGAGFIGSHLCAGLLEEGLDVIALDNLSMGKEENVPEGASLIVGDIRDRTLVGNILSDGVDIVFHEAAIVSIRESVANFYADAEVNVMGTLNLLQASVKCRVKKFIFASSMAVYADSPGKIAASESFETAPTSPYGVSKLASERYLALLGRVNSMDTIALRYFNTYGENQSFTPYVGVITIFVNRLLKGESPIIFGDGEQIRDFVNVKDVVRANLLALRSEVQGGIYNVGTGVGTSVNRIAALLCQKIDPRIKPVYGPERAEELHYSVADTARIRNELGFSPSHRIEDAIDIVIKQYS